MAELIHKQDTLNEGRVKLNNAITDAETAKADAGSAKEKSEQALAQSESTQTQLDTIVIEGDSSVEAAQARVPVEGEAYPTLKARLDAENAEVTSQLVENEQKTNFIPNATSPLIIPTYDGSGQTVHPDTIYFKNLWNGYRYWMCHTPYPKTNDFYENPSIVVSNDGIIWRDAPGVTNPLDYVSEEDNAKGVHLSDGCLVFANGNLECWYRYNDYEGNIERFYRRTTTNGRDWSPKELMIDRVPDPYLMLSPSIEYDNEKYRMWYASNNGYKLMYTESTNGKSWSTATEVPITFEADVVNRNVWHIDVYKEHSNLYHIIINTTGPSSVNYKTEILWGTSIDGNSFDNVTTIMQTPNYQSSWDSRNLYRASLIKVFNTYKLYYSARSYDNIWRIGLSEGVEMTALKGSDNIAVNGEKHVPLMKNTVHVSDRNTTKLQTIQTGQSEGPAYLKMVQAGVGGAGFKTASTNNKLRLVNDQGEELGILELSELQLQNLVYRGKSIGLPKVYIDGVDGGEAEIILRNSGKYAVRLASKGVNTAVITDELGNLKGHLELLSVTVSDTSVAKTGSIRFNTATKKHQGYDGERWNDLY